MGIRAKSSALAKAWPKPPNAGGNGSETTDSACLATILSCLQTMHKGDFSVRLPEVWTGLPGKIAEAINEIVAVNEQMALRAQQLAEQNVEAGRKNHQSEEEIRQLKQELQLRVSDRKRLEDEVRQRAELLELASEAIMVRDLNGTVLYWNSGAETVYGWRREDILGRMLHEMLHTEFPIAYSEIQDTLVDAGSWAGNLNQRAKDGREITVACRKSFNRDLRVVLEINRDISAELRAEEALRANEKLAAMGRVAGIIAHEINNPLEAITNAFFLLRDHSSLDNEARDLAMLAEQELQRVSHITKQTLGFYRESKHPIAVSLSELLEDVVDLHSRQLKVSNIEVERKYIVPGSIRGFPVELRQVFLNLVGNAVQAMPDGGRLRLKVHDATDWNSNRQGISIAVIDTGAGIEPENAKRLFQPFFSTKETKGTGLGLWISQGIVQKYEGKIRFRTFRRRTGEAVTCFRIFLPSTLSGDDKKEANDRQSALQGVTKSPYGT